MNYTRRRILRDGGRATLMLTAGSSLPFLTGCHRKPKPDPMCIGDNRPTFCPGVRVFFIGAWLFLNDPVGKGILAITRNMPSMRHTFPYGVWPGDGGGFDGTAPHLHANPSAPGVPRNAYPVTLPGFNNGFGSINDLCKDAGSNCSMSYISNPKRDLIPDFTSAHIRVVSVPFPTRLITAGFIKDAYVSDSDENHPIHSPTSSKDTKSGALATTHVFEYMGASALTFNGEQKIKSGSTGYQSDFHFHTVPPPDPDKTNPNHASEMFANLISLTGLDQTKVTLVMPHPYAKPDRGFHVPASVTNLQLEIPHDETLIGDTASCAGGGHAIGDGS